VKNALFYGDNLTIMAGMPPESVDLIYLDPPFNSQRTYNLIYSQATGLPVPEQEEAFCDAWELDAEKEEMARKMPIVLRHYGVDEGIVKFWAAWIDALRNTQPRLLAYLVYMSYRLFEMRRILRQDGSIYLHCDPTASHYIKVIMDAVFGHKNFRSEVIWKRTSAHSANRYAPVHDTILFYSKSDAYTWNSSYQALPFETVDAWYNNVEPETGRRFNRADLTAAGIRSGLSGATWRGINPTTKGRHWAIPGFVGELVKGLGTQSALDALDAAGRLFWPKREGGIPMVKRYLDEARGVPALDVITDIRPLNNATTERLGYPTQKPIDLLKRIIEASSNKGGIVFDPFCGCGTTICAAHLTERRWIGCDIAILSVKLIRDVLLARYGLKDGHDYQVEGVPLSVEGAADLFERDPRQFQHWAVELAGGFCNTQHSGDLGVDGRIYFETQDGLKNMVISVKGGNLTPAFVRELRGTIAREGRDQNEAQLGGFICLNKPTKGMWQEAASAGQYKYQGTPYDRLQIRTVDDLLAGRSFNTPSRVQTMNWQKQIPLPLLGKPPMRQGHVSPR